MDGITQTGINYKTLEGSYENFLNNVIKAYKVAYAKNKKENDNLQIEDVAQKASEIWQKEGLKSDPQNFNIYLFINDERVDLNSQTPEILADLSDFLSLSNGQIISNSDVSNIQLAVAYVEVDHKNPPNFQTLFSSLPEEGGYRVENYLDPQIIEVVGEQVDVVEEQNSIDLVESFCLTHQNNSPEISAILQELRDIKQELQELKGKIKSNKHEINVEELTEDRLRSPFEISWWQDNYTKISGQVNSLLSELQERQLDIKYAQVLEQNLNPYLSKNQGAYLGIEPVYDVIKEGSAYKILDHESKEELFSFRRNLSGYSVSTSNLPSNLKQSLDFLIENPNVRAVDADYPLNLLPVEDAVRRKQQQEQKDSLSLDNLISDLKDITINNDGILSVDIQQYKVFCQVSGTGKFTAIFHENDRIIGLNTSSEEFNPINLSNSELNSFKSVVVPFVVAEKERIGQEHERKEYQYQQNKTNLEKILNSVTFLKELDSQMNLDLNGKNSISVESVLPEYPLKEIETRITFYQNGEPIATITGNHLRTEISINDGKELASRESVNYLETAKNYFQQWETNAKEALNKSTSINSNLTSQIKPPPQILI